MQKNSSSLIFYPREAIALCLFLWLFLPMVSGQTIEDYRRRWQNEQGGFTIEGKKNNVFLQSTFYELVDGRDNELAEYLAEPWKSYVITPGTIFPKSAVPANQPTFSLEATTLGPPKNLQFNDPDQAWLLGNDKKFIVPRVRKMVRASVEGLNSSFRFYGNEIKVYYDQLLASFDAKTIDEESVRLFWDLFAKTNGNRVVDQLLDYSDQLGLDDWGYFMLVKKFSTTVYPQNRHSAKMLAWALMLRSGYQVKIGLSRSGSVILFPSSTVIYAQPFVAIGQEKYYLDENIAGVQVTTYVNNLPASNRLIDITLLRSLNFSGLMTSRKLPFVWNGKRYNFTFRFNRELIKFYEDRPKANAKVVFNAPVSSQLKDDIFRQFSPLISRMGKTEATAFLQQFVQTAFEYRSYNDLYGHDKFLYPEEMFASDGSNDKGRVALFSWLVVNLLKLPVAIIEFPGYYAAAVAFDEQIDGDFYFWNGLKYTIADPTYLSAPIGLIMPEFVGLRPRILPLDNAQLTHNQNDKIWELAMSMGAKRGGTSRDQVSDKEGNTYLTGFFEDAGKAQERISSPFVASFSKNNSLKWIRKFSSNNRAYGFALERLSDDEIYLAGSFRGKLGIGEWELETSQSLPDLFFAQMNRNGEIIWMKKAGIDSLEVDADLSYFVKFDRSGDNFFVQLMNEDDRNVQPGFFGIERNWLYFIGSRNWNVGMKRVSASESGNNFAAISSKIIAERENLITAKSDVAITGLAAMLKLIAMPNSEISGQQMQTVISSMNPNFNVSNPNLYTAIGLVEKLRNQDGIINITTANKRVLSIFDLRIANNAKIMVAEANNKDLVVRVVAGIDYSKAPYLSSLNSMIVDISAGDLIFDYDFDHTLRTANYKREVLNIK